MSLISNSLRHRVASLTEASARTAWKFTQWTIACTFILQVFSGPSSPTSNHGWLLILFLVVTESPIWRRSLQIRRELSHEPPAFSFGERPKKDAILWDLIVTPIRCLPVLLSGLLWSLPDACLIPSRNIQSSLLAAIGCWFFYFLSSNLMNTWFADHSSHHYDAFRIALIRSMLPRGVTTQWLSAIRIAFVGPVCEELIYRGCFVYLLGQLAGHAFVGIVVGYTLFLGIHLYQGPRQNWHADGILSYCDGIDVFSVWACGVDCVSLCNQPLCCGEFARCGSAIHASASFAELVTSSAMSIPCY